MSRPWATRWPSASVSAEERSPGLAQQGRSGRAHDHQGHLLRRCAQCVADDLQGDRIDGRAHLPAPVVMWRFPARSDTSSAPGGTTTVDHASSTTAGPAIGRLGAQVRAGVARRGHRPARIECARRAPVGSRLCGGAAGRRPELAARPGGRDPESNRHELPRLPCREAVQVPVAVEELAVEVFQVVEVGAGNLDGIALAAVPDRRNFLDRHLALVAAGRRERRRQPGLEVAPHPVQAFDVPVVHRHAQGALLRVAHLRAHAAESGEDAGMRGDDHLGDAEGAGQLHRVHRPRAPEREQRAPATVDAAFHRDPAQSPQHRRVRHPHHAEGGLFHRLAHRRRERRDGGSGRTGVEPDTAADHAIGIHVTQHQVGVRHRRPCASAGVAGGTGIGPGALRSDHQGTVVEAGDRAAAGSDGLHRDHRLTQRPAAERSVARHLRLAGEHQADIGRGASHVEADGVIDVELAGDPARGGDAGRGAGGGKSERQLAQRIRRGHAAGGVEEMQPRPRRLLGVEPIEVARGERHDPRAQRRGCGALVLPGLRIDSIRQRDERESFAQPLAQRLLVDGIGVGMEERHRDRSRATGFDAPDRVVDRSRINRLEHPAFVIDPFVHLEAQRIRNLRGELGREVEAVEVEPILTRDGEGVGEAPGGDQGDLGQIVLDDGVGHEGRAVDQVLDVRPCEIDGPQSGQQSGHTVIGAGRHLCDSRVEARAADRDHVRERAADIDAYPPSVRHDRTSRGSP